MAKEGFTSGGDGASNALRIWFLGVMMSCRKGHSKIDFP